jgi:FHS family Na+ dependent glucose MFS transporter 1
MRARPLTILSIDFAGCLVSLGLILFFSQSATLLWIGTILFGISQASIFPTFLTLAEERMHITGTITGWFLVGAGLGGMILPWLIGQAFVRIGAGAMIGIILVNVALNVLMLFVFTKASATQKSLTERRAIAD